MNAFDWYVKQVATYNPWVRFPTLLAACIGITMWSGGWVWGIIGTIILMAVGIILCAAGNYHDNDR